MKPLIFHIDVNSAFLSWEAVRRISQGENDIRLIPSAIGGDRDKRTGVILAKSIPAKKYGIKTGEPVAMALRKCPDLFLARPDFRLYEQSSKAFMDIVRSYAPVVEKYSIDECFADFSGTQKIYPDPIALAYLIKDRIRDELGFTVNMGIGDCKLLAKMASDFEKPDKVHTLSSGPRFSRSCGRFPSVICLRLELPLQKNLKKPEYEPSVILPTLIRPRFRNWWA